jgi:hypothetical protein
MNVPDDPDNRTSHHTDTTAAIKLYKFAFLSIATNVDTDLYVTVNSTDVHKLTQVYNRMN